MEPEEYGRMAHAEDSMWWYQGLHGWLTDRVRSLLSTSGTTILDCGSGTGGLSRRLSSLPSDVRLFGIDINSAAVQLYAERAKRPVVCGSVNCLPFSENEFDIIICADLLYHNAVIEADSIAELFRCTRPGGSVLLNLPAYSWMKSSHDIPIHTARRYTAGTAARAMKSGGFEIMEATYRNTLLFPIMLLWRVTVGRLTSRSDVEDFPMWQEFVFRRVIAFENFLARLGARFPFGGSVYIRGLKAQ